jgi:integrase
MRRRYREGSLKKQDGYWVAMWWEDGHRRSRHLGKVSELTKADARAELAKLTAPANLKHFPASLKVTVGDFVEHIFLPFYRRKWKSSTAKSNEYRLTAHVVPGMVTRTMGSITRDELQDFLEKKAGSGLSYSTVAHLRWDFKQIFDLAQAEGYVQRNPAILLFVPRNTPRPQRLVMNGEEVKRLFSVLEQRERLIVKLAVLAGMRPGEIFGLKWGRLQTHCIQIRQRVYRGEVDTPKTVHSVRDVALSDGLLNEIENWRNISMDSNPNAWVFPSEKLVTPLAKDNCWRRRMAPQLNAAGLSWVTFQVMRRTHSSLLDALKVDPKVVADMLGHTLDVNQNVYTVTQFERRKEAVNSLEFSLS